MTPSYIAIYLSVPSPDNSSTLQSDIDLLVEWCRVWQIKLDFVNIKLSLGLNSPSRQYIMGTSTELHQIRTINEDNDLGITFTNDFKFRSHTVGVK